MVRSALVLSFIDRARPGDLHDPDPDRRAAAWANWCIDAMVEASNGERSYPAIRLPGAFYDPRNSGPRIVPHLEIPRRRLEAPDAEFPDRLAQLGNGVSFPYWRYDEVTALRRALFNTGEVAISPLVELLNRRRSDLVHGLELANRQAQSRWSVVAEQILAAGEALSAELTTGFDTPEIAEYLPAAAELGLRIEYDARLAERNGAHSARRVGIFQLVGHGADAAQFALGVVIPRLTVNSLFNDELFEPTRESPAALLVRSLVLRRLVRRYLSAPERFQVGDPAPDPGRSYLRGIPARPGQKLPEASVRAALQFLETYPDPAAAWALLERWSTKGYILTVTAEGFTQAHRRASRAARRMEDPERADIDTLLPLAWDTRDDKAQVVRVSFTADE